jgi:uncharacterized protein (DUF1800 family)
MELFSLGTGNYSENDIREGARALTGWSTQPYEFHLYPRLHDGGEKSILGEKGQFDGDGFVKLILKQSACAEFMARKLWVYFAGESPAEPPIKELAAVFCDAGYDIKILLSAMFQHPLFYSSDVVATQIKSPLQLVVDTARTLSVSGKNNELYGRMLLMMGQVPYYPPNVKGWPGGRTWIDTSRLVTRYTFAKVIGDGKVPTELDPRAEADLDGAGGEMEGQMMEDQASEMKDEPGQGKKVKKLKDKFPSIKKLEKSGKGMLPPSLKVDFDAEKLVGSKMSPAEAVDRIIQLLLPVSVSKEERETLISNLEKWLAAKPREEALQALVGQVMLLPSYQLC